MIKSLLIALTLCVILQIASAQQLSEKLLSSNYVQMHNAPLIPQEWTRFFDHANIAPHLVGEVLNNQRTKITFALHSQNLEVLNAKFEAITDPESPMFRKYMTSEEVAKLTSPHSSHKTLVMEYIKSIPDAKLVSVSAHENFVTVDMSLKSLDRLFKTKMTPFIHKASGKIIYRSEQGFALPQSLSFAVKTLIGVHNFPVLQHKAKKVARVMDSYSLTTPQELWRRYNISLPATTSPKSSQAVGSFLGQYVSVEDLLQFQQTYNLPITKPTLIGPNVDSEPGVEAALDIQYIISTGYLINTTINSTPTKYDDEDPFLYWAIAQQKLGEKSAFVHSISYGGVEKYQPRDYLTSLDLEFQKLTITGRSILIASGDNGARCSDSGDAFEPEWPTSSPFVTSVGATRPDSQYVERAVSWGGGGFSAFYPRPKYQAAAVNSYLAQNSIPPTSYFNVNGRMYPDIAALGVDYQVVVNGQIQSVAGTSASTPTTAGIISLLNDLRFKAGKGPLGFLNPWLYKTVLTTQGATFDIVQGNNGVSPCPGFPATKGVDAITGVGVPNFAVLARLAVQGV